MGRYDYNSKYDRDLDNWDFDSSPRRNAAEPEQYLHSLSATLLPFLKVLDGAVGAFILFYVLRFFLQIAGETGTLMQKFLSAVNEGLSTIDVVIPELHDYLTKIQTALTQGTILPVIAYGIVMGIIIFLACLLVIECLCLFTLRFARTGAGAIRFIHWFYAITALLSIAGDIYFLYSAIRSSGKLKSADRNLLIGHGNGTCRDNHCSRSGYFHHDSAFLLSC